MTRDETKQLLMVIQAAYPNYHPQDKTVTINLWYAMLGGYEYRAVMAATQTYIATDTRGFAPAIGQIIDKLQTLAGPQFPDEMEAWAMYRKALSHASSPKEEYDKLPEIVQKTIGDYNTIYYTGTNPNFNEDITRANFLKSYRIICDRERELAKMPARVLIESTNNKLEG